VHFDSIYQFCTKKDYAGDSFTYNGFDFTRVPVKGMMTSETILQACARKGLRPVCDHLSYTDGKCRMAASYSFHMSYPAHNDQYGVPREKVLGAYFYSGKANGQWSFLNMGYTHRWSGTKDINGDTFCVKKADETLTTFEYAGRTLIRTPVSGTMTVRAIRTACTKLGTNYKPVCDQNSNADGRCIAIGGSENFREYL
jgi:hypothetical protein